MLLPGSRFIPMDFDVIVHRTVSNHLLVFLQQLQTSPPPFVLATKFEDLNIYDEKCKIINLDSKQVSSQFDGMF